MKRTVTSTRIGATAMLAATMTLGACSFVNPISTNLPYEPADGVEATVGQLDVRGLMLIGEGEGPAVISGSAVNMGDEEMTVQFAPVADAQSAAPAGGSEITLGPREQVNLADEGLQLDGIEVKPGLSVPMTVTSDVYGEIQVSVPLLAPELEYSTLTPTTAPTTATATATATATN